MLYDIEAIPLEPHQVSATTLKPLRHTNSVVEPELAGEVDAGKSHQLAFRQSLPVFSQFHGLYISNMALYRPIVPYL